MLVAILLAASAYTQVATASALDAPLRASSVAGVSGMTGYVPPTPPLFIRNRGQFPTNALYIARFPGMFVRVEPGALLLQLFQHGNPASGVLVRMEFEGASPTHEVVGENRQDVVFSYFRGNDPEKWQRDVGSFGAVRLRNLYDGIDLVVRDESGIPKYDLFVAPGADLSRVVVRVQGVDSIASMASGELRFQTALGDLRQPEGRTWQVDDSGEKRWMKCRYRMLDESRFGFEVPDADPSRPLVVDPGLIWSTYLGSSINPAGPGDIGRCVDIDVNGDVGVSGDCSWYDFPVTPGAYPAVGAHFAGLFVSKLRASDGSLLYSVVIGGFQTGERAHALKFGQGGRVTVAGYTGSANFPTTVGAFDRVNNDGLWAQYDAFVLRLNPDGSDLEYSTYLGRTGDDRAYGLAIAPSGATVVAGQTGGDDFPTTPGAYDPQNAYTSAGFIARLDPIGSSLEWSTFLGSDLTAIRAVAMDAAQGVTVTGETETAAVFPVTPGALVALPGGGGDFNVFVARLNSTGSSLLWGALIGGADLDKATGVAVDALGDAYICGYTSSDNFPTTPGVFQEFISTPGDIRDPFVARVSSSGATLVYSTYLGALADDIAWGIAVDPSGFATVAGWSYSAMSATLGAFDTVNQGGDMFIARIYPDGAKRIYTTFLGGPSEEGALSMGMNPAGRVAVAGWSRGPGYPTTPGATSTSYVGGASDAVISVIELHPQGVAALGDSTQGCLGPLQLQVSGMPVVGAQSFSFLCSTAPPGRSGWLLVSSAAPANPVTRVGANIFVDPNQLVARVAVTSDSTGFVETHMPSLLTSSGTRYFAQFVFTGNCGGQSGWTASNALELTVQ